MQSVWLSLYWGSPIGLGVFLAGLGVFIWMVSHARSQTPKQ